MYDVIVIGTGICGAAAARELSRYDLKVLVLEKGSDLCSGASRGNSAMVHGGFDADPGTEKAKYNVAGNRMFDQLCGELNVPFERSGTLILATTEAEVPELYRLKEKSIENGVETILMDTEALKKRWPDMKADAPGGLFCPSGGMVCPYGLVFALCENAAENGVEFRRSALVTKVERAGEAWDVVLASGERLRTKIVMNCAGTHADEFNNMVSDRKFTIIPRFGGHIIMDRKYIPWVDTTITQTPTPLPTGGHTKGMGIMPSVDGTVILGCEATDHTDKDDVSLPRESIDQIVNYFKGFWKYLPISAASEEFPMDGIISAYGGLRPHPDTDDFVIGEAPGAPGFINAAGIESPGLTAGPAIGKHIAELAAEMLDAAPDASFDPVRHVKKPFRVMTDEERAAAIAENPDYAKIVCRCELVTEAEIRDAIRRPVGARSVGGVKMRTRAGMGRCQGGFCQNRVVEILAEELGIAPTEVLLSGEGSNILTGECCEVHFKEAEA